MTTIHKLVNNARLRVWITPRNDWYIQRKTFKPLGYVVHLGRLRISCTLIKPRYILFNPYTLQRIEL